MKLATTVGLVALVLGLHALPTHAEGTVLAPPVNVKPPTLCVKHQTYTSVHGKTVTGCEPIAQFEREGRVLTPGP